MRVSFVAAAAALAFMTTTAPAPAAARESGEVVTVAKKTVKRSSRRPSSARAPARRGSGRGAAAPAKAGATAIPLPREKPDATTEAAVPAPATEAAPAKPVASRPLEGVPVSRGQLKSYYLITVLSDRCGFPITTKQGVLLDHRVSALEKALGLSDQDADALYSEVDRSAEARGRESCAAESGEAKSFRATLETLAEP